MRGKYGGQPKCKMSDRFGVEVEMGVWSVFCDVKYGFIFGFRDAVVGVRDAIADCHPSV